MGQIGRLLVSLRAIFLLLVFAPTKRPGGRDVAGRHGNRREEYPGIEAIVPVLMSTLTRDPSSKKATGGKWKARTLRSGTLSCWLTSKASYSSPCPWLLLRIQPGIRESATKTTAATPR